MTEPDSHGSHSGDTPNTTEETPSEHVAVDDSSYHTRRISRVGRLFLGLVKKGLYIAFLVAAVALLLKGAEYLAKLSVAAGRQGDYYSHDLSLAKRDNTRPVSHYDYDFSPRVCLETNILKGNRYEYANNAGFREPEDIALEKPEDEFRIFITGGSTAFGLGATGQAADVTNWRSIPYRETISHMMEMILNATAPLPGKKIRVYNTAVWGHAYQHNLIRYITKLRRYNPDMVVSIDGANEIQAISALTEDWDYFNQGQYSNVMDQIFSYDPLGLSSYLTLWFKNNTYLMTALQAGGDTLQTLTTEIHYRTWDASSSESTKELNVLSVEERSKRADSNISTVVRMVENYHSVLHNDGVPHIFVTQPLLYLSKKPLHAMEEKIVTLDEKRSHMGVPSDKIYSLLITRLVESAQRNRYFLADFSRYFDDVSEWVFLDWCHLTAGANYLIAKELSTLIKERLFQQPLTGGDRLGVKDSYFYDFATSAEVEYAPPAVRPESGPDKALSGYPTEGRSYESKAVTASEKLEMTLKLTQEIPLSRCRIVWADERAVPEEWVIETSVDAQTWEPFVRANRNQTDSYSRWPGFEYYAPRPVQARYVKYRPVETEDRSIRLRAVDLLQ